MLRTVNIPFASSCFTGHFWRLSSFKSIFVVELLLFGLVGIVFVYYMLIHTGSVAALKLSQVGS